MAGRPRRMPLALLATVPIALAAGCGKSSPEHQAPSPSAPLRSLTPVAAQGAVSLATRNTTRLGGVDVVSDAAAVARAVYPGLTPQTRPAAVVVVDNRDWSTALAASAFASAPIGAPIVYAEGASLPEVSASTIAAVQPSGLGTLDGAQVIEVGSTAPIPSGLVVRHIAAGEPAVTAASIATTLQAAAGGGRPRQVIVVPANAPRALQMPAAGLAAESGAPILFVDRTRIPQATAQVLTALRHPSIYVLAPTEAGARTMRELRSFGSVTAIAAPSSGAQAASATANSVAVARFTDGTFGWGVREPGQGFVFANSGRPFDAPATAILSGTGDYAPLLLLDRANEVPADVTGYLTDLQPGYTSGPQFGPAHALHNHGWVIGDEGAITATTQAELDSLLASRPRGQTSGEAAVAQSE
jgi:hypothetical protein